MGYGDRCLHGCFPFAAIKFGRALQAEICRDTKQGFGDTKGGFGLRCVSEGGLRTGAPVVEGCLEAFAIAWADGNSGLN